MKKSQLFGLQLGALGVIALTAGCERNKPAPERMNAAKAGAPASVTGLDGATRSPEPGPSVSQVPVPKDEDPMAHLDQDMQLVLAELQMLGAKPIESLSVADARKQPTPADAVKSLLERQGKSTEPETVAKVEERKLPGGAVAIPVRIYTPSASGALPVIVYYHGGGFVIADNDVYDATPRALANGAKAVVVSVEYRKGPEQKFPAAHDDAFAAYRWVTKNAASLGADPRRIAVAGESAGANLAENVAIMARDQHLRQPLHVLLVYPIASSNMSSESYVKYRDAKPLNKQMMIWFFEQYLRGATDERDPRIDLVSAKLTGLPETTIINAEIDPLLSDGTQLAEKLKAAEVSVKQKTYDGVTHEFFGMGKLVANAKDATDFASDRLKKSFEAAANRDETALSNDDDRRLR